MVTSQVDKILEALDSAGIDEWNITDDINCQYYHNKNAVIKVDKSNELFLNFRKFRKTGVSSLSEFGNVEISAIPFVDIHNMSAIGSKDEILKFVQSLGVSFKDDEWQIILNIDKGNYDIKPETGDYVSRFHYLTDKQYAELSDEEKTQYDADLAEYKKKVANYIEPNMAASLSLK